MNKDKKAKQDSKQESKDLIVKKEKRVDTSKWFKDTSLTILLIAIIVVVCIGINIVVENVNLEDIDFTQDKIHSLSDETRQITENIDKEVEIILINMSESEEALTNQYRSINDKISAMLQSDRKIYMISTGDKVIVMANRTGL